ncbi:hypothetical protein G6F17_000901 [Rhizopus arrhizus]|nr:hypothetical protein G6F20_009894 [Rhizopus arrhizus]KAG0860559.1 hypothetical protein G6F17_000901 [Rhizopus arrhizus]KAG0893191.1 hypothetical protein G6F34_010205 [Rhizopus arrhizus]
MSVRTWESTLTPEEVAVYKQCFKAAVLSQPNAVTGMEAVQFFGKSGLPNTTLSEIWETADEQNLGYLTQDTFAIALKLIACAQNNIKPKKHILSTITPLPRIKDITDHHASITPVDRAKYQAIYRSQNPSKNGIDAQTAKNLFLKSKLSNEQLAQIWNLADIRQCGYLNETEFIIAMYYIEKIMRKSITTLPSILPQSIYHDALGNQKVHSTITPQERAKYDPFFRRLDRTKKGWITKAEAINFFKNSKLPDKKIAEVWNTADPQGRSALDSEQFALAMHLIHAQLVGKSMSPSSTVFTTSPQPVASILPEQDLLGDFGDNGKITEETNKLNHLKNQIESTQTATQDLQTKRHQLELAWTTLQEKRSDLQQQSEQLQSKKQTESEQLKQLRLTLEDEETVWQQVKTEFERAQRDLETARVEIEQAQKELKEGQDENERLRRTVHDVQVDALRYTQQLDALHAKHKRKQERAAKRAAEKAEAERVAAELKKQEEERKRQEEEERKRQEEEELKKQEEEERKKQEEEERKRQEEEEERKRQEEEECKRQEEEERKKQEEEERKRQDEEERKKLEEEEHMKQEEHQRIDQEQQNSNKKHLNQDELVDREVLQNVGYGEVKDTIQSESNPSTEKEDEGFLSQKEYNEAKQDQIFFETPKESQKAQVLENPLANQLGHNEIIENENFKEYTKEPNQLQGIHDEQPFRDELNEIDVVPTKDKEQIKDSFKPQNVLPETINTTSERKDGTENKQIADEINNTEINANESKSDEKEQTGQGSTESSKPDLEDGQDLKTNQGDISLQCALSYTEAEGTDSMDDFYDAIDTGNLTNNPPRHAINDHKQDTRTTSSSADENEFVMIDHPSSLHHIPKKSHAAEFDDVFGITKAREEEEEPVIVSSLSESEMFDTNARPTVPLSSAQGLQPSTHAKKPPTPPPPPGKSIQNVSTTPLINSDNFDAIFGVKQKNNKSHDQFASHLENEETKNGKTTSIVSPTPKNPYEQEGPSTSSLGSSRENQTSTSENDSGLNNHSLIASSLDERHENEDMLNTTEAKKINLGEHDRGIQEEAPTKEMTPEIDDKKKKKKKKNIMSWAKTLGGFDGEKKKKKRAEKEARRNSKNNTKITASHTYSANEQPIATQSPIATTPANNNKYSGTIHDSHIAELVNMGFDPKAAKEALDRYDQDLEKATNFLLDQS